MRNAVLLLLLAIVIAIGGALFPSQRPVSANNVAAITAGGTYTCALTEAGGVKCWGANGQGQLGDNGNCGLVCSTPTDVLGLSSGVTAITAGGSYTCALTEAGGVKCWGVNGRGQLGDDTTGHPSCGCRPTPVDVVGLSSGVTAIAGGNVHTCALTTAGGVKCWGYNIYGQLGDASTDSRIVAVDVVGLDSGVTAITAGKTHTCALTEAGGVKCWGRNLEGQLGDSGNCGVVCSTPTDVLGLSSGVVAVSADHHTCALTTAGGVKCWGYNLSGELGNGTWGPYAGSSVPVDVCEQRNAVTLKCVQLLAAKTISAGAQYTCAVTTADGVKCWGRNLYGILGDGTLERRTIPVDVVGLTSGVAAVSAGREHTCALTTTNVAKCWGLNTSGQLGTVTDVCYGSSTSCSTTPVDVAGLKSASTPAPGKPTAVPPGPTSTPVTSPPSDDLLGDSNCDGSVNAIDAALVLQLSAGLIGSPPCPGSADVNGDGSINAIDAALILQYSAGLIPGLLR